MNYNTELCCMSGVWMESSLGRFVVQEFIVVRLAQACFYGNGRMLVVLSMG